MIDDAMADIDLDNDGYLSYSEYAAGLRKPKKEQQKESEEEDDDDDQDDDDDEEEEADGLDSDESEEPMEN